MVIKNDNGYVVNGNMISSQDAYSLFRFIEREYYKEDIWSMINEEYNEETANAVTENEDLINRMIDDYDDYRGNDEQWCYDVREVIHNFKEEIERIEAETVIPLF